MSDTLTRNPRFRELEEAYGRYLYLPLDVPRIDLGPDFPAWFQASAKRIKKINADVAGGTGVPSMFRSVDFRSDETAPTSEIWQLNVREDIIDVFPTLKEQVMDLLPFARFPAFSIWSSIAGIAPHRDHSPCMDFPSSWRTMLYDTNPEPTLFCVDAPCGKPIGNPFHVRPPVTTNTFVWNNMRVKHFSRASGRYTKMLLIYGRPRLDVARLVPLFDRSISKFGTSLKETSNASVDYFEET